MERIDQRLGELGEGFEDKTRVIGTTRRDLGQMARDLYGQMTGRRSDRKERDTSRASRR